MEGLKFLSSKKKSDSPLSNFTLSFHISFSILEGNIEDRLESRGKWGSLDFIVPSKLVKYNKYGTFEFGGIVWTYLMFQKIGYCSVNVCIDNVEYKCTFHIA